MPKQRDFLSAEVLTTTGILCVNRNTTENTNNKKHKWSKETQIIHDYFKTEIF